MNKLYNLSQAHSNRLYHIHNFTEQYSDTIFAVVVMLLHMLHSITIHKSILLKSFFDRKFLRALRNFENAVDFKIFKIKQQTQKEKFVLKIKTQKYSDFGGI